MADQPQSDPNRPPDFRVSVEQSLAGAVDAQSFLKTKDWLVNAILEAVSTALGWVLTLGARIGVLLAGSLARGEDKAHAEFEKLAAVAIEDMFGVKVEPRGLADRGNRGGREAASSSIGDMLLRAFAAQAGDSASTSLEPSDEPAKRFLSSMAQIALEGWLEGWIVEACSLGQLETFGDLDDTISHILGLGRASAAVHGPLVKHLIVTPLDWKVNKAYRPTILTASQAIDHWMRGHLDEPARNEILARHGHSDEAIEALVFAARRYLSPADAGLLVAAGAWSKDDALQELRDAGHERDRAERLWQLEEVKLIRRFQLQLAEAAVDAYVDHRIDESTMHRLVASAGLDDRTAERLTELAAQRHLVNVKHLSIAQLEQAVEFGVLAVVDYRRHLERQGYDDEAILALELSLRVKLKHVEDVNTAKAAAAADRAAAKAAKNQELQARRAELERQHATFTGTPAQAERLVVRGLMTTTTYRQILIDNGIVSADAGALVELAAQDAAKYAEDLARRQAAAAAVNVPKLAIATLERAVKLGALTIDQYRGALLERGFRIDDVDLMIRLLEKDIADDVEARRRRDAAAAKVAAQGLSLAQEERAVREGILSIDDYRRFLIQQKFSTTDVATLVALLQRELADDLVAKQRRAAADARLAIAEISLADEERSVRAGLRSVDDYRAFLVDHKFSADDVAVLAALLEQEIADDAAAAATHADVDGQLAAKSLSLGQVEQAVVAGVLGLDQYRAFLERQGLSSADAAVLVALLTPRVETARAALGRRGQLEAQAGGRGVSLSDARKAVVAGVSSLEHYALVLETSGYGLADRQLLVDLLAVELAQTAAARAKRDAAAGILLERNFSIAAAEDLVKSGARSLDEYAAFLAESGIAPEDVPTLVALLRAQLEA